MPPRSKYADSQGRIGITDFLRQFADAFETVEREINSVTHGPAPATSKWWELFDLDVEPQTADALDTAWKAWRRQNHPDKGICSDQRFRHMAQLYEQQRARLA